ncbi:hypothetical protein CF326_g6566 [Tilletia indica]|nr:hypothetical protein CF326_g6566 [Tilletia indica]
MPSATQRTRIINILYARSVGLAIQLVEDATDAELLRQSGDLSEATVYQDEADCYQEAAALLEHTLSVTSGRYIVPRDPLWRPSERLIDRLEAYEMNNELLRYRSHVRMEPGAFKAAAAALRTLPSFQHRRGAPASVEEKLSVALFRLGHDGQGASAEQIAALAGCSVGSVYNWTVAVVGGMAALESYLVDWASEKEKEQAKDWVELQSGVPEWRGGFAAVDGTHVNLAWAPGLGHGEGFFSRKHRHSLNVQLVSLPTTLRIISYCIGPRGATGDQSAWAQSAVAQAPYYYLERDEWLWADKGYPYHAYIVAPYRHQELRKSKDLRRFNFWLSHLRVRAEHSMGYLKGRFSSLKGMRGIVVSEEGELRTQDSILACICLHNLAMGWDDAARYKVYIEDGLGRDLADDDIWWDVDDGDAQEQQRAWARRAREESSRRAAQQGRDSQTTTNARNTARIEEAKTVRERLHGALNRAHSYAFEDTTRVSRFNERTAEQQAAADRRKARQRLLNQERRRGERETQRQRFR